MLLYTYLLISVAQYNVWKIYLILLNKASDVLPAITCANAFSCLWSIFWVVNISLPFPWFDFDKNIPLSG